MSVKISYSAVTKVRAGILLVNLSAVFCACVAQNSYLEGEPSSGTLPQRKFYTNTHELTEEGLSLMGLSKEDSIRKKLLGESERLAKLFVDGVPTSARASIQHNPGLDLVAHLHARARIELNTVPSEALTNWMFWQTGSTSAFYQSIGWEASSFGTTQKFDEALREQGAKDPWSDGPYDFGVARPQFGGRIGQAVVLAKKYAEVYGLADSYAPGGTLELAGKVFRSQGKMFLFLGTTEATVLQQDFTPNADGTFRISLTLPTTTGRAFLQIAEWHKLASEPSVASGYWTNALLIPIFIGAREPIKPDEFITQSEADPGDPAARLAKIVEVYNAERAKHGLEPMVLSAEVSGLSKEKLPEANNAGRNDSELFAKLASLGLPAKSVRWQWGQLQKVVEHAETSLLIPSYRSIILDPKLKVTGLAIQPGTQGISTYLQFYVEPLPALDATERKAELQLTLNQAREAKGRKPFKRHGPTEKVLDEFAKEVCDGKLQKGQFGALQQKLSKRVRISGGRILESLNHYFELPGEDDESFGEVYQSKASHLAIAICRGDFQGPDTKEYVLLLTFQPLGSAAR